MIESENTEQIAGWGTGRTGAGMDEQIMAK
jgi:hypothetical protein